jgi:hypothetical protein
MPRATDPPRAAIIGMLSSDAVAVTVRLGDLLEFPEHPDKGNAEADDDAQKHQGQARSCEHGEHPKNDASGVPKNVNKKAASVQNTPKPREFPDRCGPQQELNGAGT